MKNLLFCLVILSSNLYSQIPAYYKNINFNKNNEEIRSQLHRLIRNTHIKRLDYTPDVWKALKVLDQDPKDNSKVLLVYGYDDNDDIWSNDRSRDKNMTCNIADCVYGWNREHVYPKSIGNFSPTGLSYTDVHALRSSDPQMNETRFNNPYIDGEGEAHLIDNNKFYPGDEWKGDVARMILYMYLRYPKNCKPNYVGYGQNTYSKEVPDIFLEWNAEDPVSEFEIRRNNLIESVYQGNRNPFIDNPYLATMIWGGPKAENFWDNMSNENWENQTFEIYPNPTIDAVYYNADVTSVVIYDNAGNRLKEDDDLTDNKTILPDNKGLYIIEFCNQSNCHTFKVLKK